MKLLTRAILTVLLLTTVTLIVPSAFAQTQNLNLQSLISSIFTNPSTLMIFVIELALGIGLGYFSAKIFKYVIALIGIFVIGVLLNIWQTSQTGSSVQDQLTGLGLTWNTVYPALVSLIYMLGLTTVLPITLGFIIGLVIAIAK